MKKILSTVAALGLVAGMATAAQAVEFKVSGHYFLEGVYQSSGTGAGVSLTEDAVTSDENTSDAFWRHEFIIKPVMKVNDKIVVKSKIYLANTPVDDSGATEGTWGADDTTNIFGKNINVHHLFMEYMSPIGKVRMGRTSSGLWQGSFLSSDKNDNRLMYFPNFLPKPFGACVFLQKTSEMDSNMDDVADNDYDLYEASAWYKTKDLVVAMGYDYFRDTRDITLTPGTAAYYDFLLALNVPAVAAVTADAKITKHLIKGYYNQNMGNIYAEMEFAYVWGDKEWTETATALTDDEYDSFAIMADVGMTMDKLDMGMMFFYASGDENGATDDDLSSALSVGGNGLGEQFQPYTILTGASTGMLTGDYNSADAAMTAAGVMSVGVHADFAVNDKLSLHSAIAYAEADEAGVDVADEYGWEIDLGASYALLDNLTYSVDFGYLMTGEYFEGVLGVDDTNDIFVLNHRLTMEF